MDYRTYSLAELLPEALERLTGRRTPEDALTRNEPSRPSVPPRLPKPDVVKPDGARKPRRR